MASTPRATAPAWTWVANPLAMSEREAWVSAGLTTRMAPLPVDDGRRRRDGPRAGRPVRMHWMLGMCVVCGHERVYGEPDRATCPPPGCERKDDTSLALPLSSVS